MFLSNNLFSIQNFISIFTNYNASSSSSSSSSNDNYHNVHILVTFSHMATWGCPTISFSALCCDWSRFSNLRSSIQLYGRCNNSWISYSPSHSTRHHVSLNNAHRCCAGYTYFMLSF